MKKLEKQEIIKLEMQCILVIKKLCWGNSKGEIIDVSCDNGQWKIMNLNDFSIQRFENRAVAEKYIRDGNFVFMGTDGMFAKNRKGDEIER